MKLPALFSAPHRIFFWEAIVLALLLMGAWAWDMAARYGAWGTPPVWTLPPLWWHGLSMVYGMLPCFMFGFLMTALPKWVGAPALTLPRYLPAALAVGGGWLLLLVAPAALLVGGALVMAGWAWGLYQLARSAWIGPKGRHDGYVYGVLLPLAWGWLSGALALGALAEKAGNGVDIALQAGLWGFALPIFFVVAHRMVPFFTQSALAHYRAERPRLHLFLGLGALMLHGLLQILGAWRWTWLPDGVGAVAVGLLAWRWQPWRVRKIPMLAMLHLAVVWLALGLALSCLQSLLQLAGVAWAGWGPLHVLTLGFMCSLLLGMGTRVSLGHSGRSFSWDRRIWPLFLIFQFVPLLRLAGDFLAPGAWWHPFVLASGLWLLVFAVWGVPYLGIYCRPRPDGQPG